MDCLFCKITAGEIISDTVYQDERVSVFRDIHPKAPVHLLVVPRVHIASIADLQAGQEDLTASLIYIAKEVAGAQGLQGYKLLFNVGHAGGQVIDHLHLHLMGGWE